jgi:hypothetical protein
VFKEQIARLHDKLMVVLPRENHAEIADLAALLAALPADKQSKLAELAAMTQQERSLWVADAPNERSSLGLLAMAISGMDAVPKAVLTPLELTTLKTVVRSAKLATMAETMCACSVALSPVYEAEMISQARSIGLTMGELATELDANHMEALARDVGLAAHGIASILDKQERIQDRSREEANLSRSCLRLARFLPRKTYTNAFEPYYEEIRKDFIEAAHKCGTRQEFDDLVRVFKRRVAWAVVSSYRVHILEALVENQNYIIAALGVLTALFAFLKSMMEFARLFP